MARQHFNSLFSQRSKRDQEIALDIKERWDEAAARRYLIGCPKVKAIKSAKRKARDAREGLPASRYHAYINSSQWRKIRREFWSLFGETCQVQECPEVADLHVHHHTYVRLGRERWGDLVGLCADHHGEVHAFHKANLEELSMVAGADHLTLATERVTGLDLGQFWNVKP